MADAQPVAVLLILSGCGLFWLALDWVGTSSQVRAHRLTTIAQAEAATTAPPPRLAEQVRWLLTHRRHRLQSLSLLLGLGSLIGLGEGLAWRRRDPQAGVRLRNWTLGVLGLALTPGLVGALLLLPMPWSVVPVAWVGTAWCGVTFFLLSSGRPYVA